MQTYELWISPSSVNFANCNDSEKSIEMKLYLLLYIFVHHDVHIAFNEWS